MKRLLLHIGTGKTGTSSIQNFLFANRKQLAENFSVFYPEQGLSNMAHFGELIHAHYPIVSWISERQTENLEKLSLALNTSGCETGIISCENFYHHCSAEDIAFLATVFKQFSVEIICYVRRQDLYMESAWKQQVKVGALKTPFPDFLQRHIQAEYLEEVHGNYHRMLKHWAAVFGIQNIRVRVFDKSEWLNGDLIDDFLNTCGLDIEKTNSAFIKQAHTNTAFPSELIRLIQKTNAMALIPKADQQDFVDYLSKLNSFNDSPLLSTSERLAIIKNYQPTNRALFTQFCNRQIPKCFRPVSIKNTAKEENSQWVLLEDVAIKAIVEIWKKSSSNQYIACLEKNINLVPHKLFKNTLLSHKEIDIKQNSIKLNLILKKLRKVVFSNKDDISSKEKTIAQIKFNKGDEISLTNIDPLVIPSPSIISGQHLACYSFLPKSTQHITPSIWLGNGAIASYQQNTAQVPPANMYEFHNVWLMAHGCVVDAQTRMFTSPHLIAFGGRGGLKAGLNPKILDMTNEKLGKVILKNQLKSRKITEPCVSLAQPGEWAYGHWLVDILPRAVFAQQLGIKVKYLATNRLPDYGRELLKLIGIMDEDIVVYDPHKEAILMELCFFPSHLRWHSAISPLLATVREKIAPYQAPCINRKLFISRGDYNAVQSVTNIKKVHHLMSDYGIEIIEPHKYSIEEQIRLFSEADLVIGEYGSAMHNTLFSHPGTKIIVLQSDAPLPFIQAGMGAVLNQPTGFVFGKHMEENDTNNRTKGRSFEAPVHFIKQAIEQSL